MDTLQKINSLLDNDKFATVTSLVIALYAGMAAPALPDSVVLFFDTVVGKLLFLFLIGYVASRNLRVALMVAVAFVVTLHVVNQRTTERYFNYQKSMFARNQNTSDFTVNVDEHFEHPLAENLSPKDTFSDSDQPEDYITTDTFRNYNLENFEDGGSDGLAPPSEGPGSLKEHLEPNSEHDHFQPNIEEGGHGLDEGGHGLEEGGHGLEEGGHGLEEGGHGLEEGGHGLEEGGDDVEENFYSNINPSVKNMGVNPANNTLGSSNNMFAPVKFN